MSDEFRFEQRKSDTDLPTPDDKPGRRRVPESKTLLWVALGVIVMAVFVVIIASVFR